MSRPATSSEHTSLRELTLLFLRLGTTAFGGPAAHIAMMQNEVVVRRKWLSDERFLDLLGATNLIPGPNSTELAIHIGWARRGFLGLIVAGLSFIVPAMLITAAFAWAYLRFGTLPAAGDLLYGIKPVIVGVVAQAIYALLPKAARTWPLRALLLLSVVLYLLGVDELIVLFGAGALSMLASRQGQKPKGKRELKALFLAAVPSAAPLASGITLTSIFWVFLKIGSVLFGSGYVLIAFLRADLVERLGWLTESQLLDAVAVGQITPGPVFTTATFIGYLLSGPSGALVATTGIFLPAFVFVALSAPFLPRLRASAATAALLDGLNVSSLGLMIVATLQLGRACLRDPLSILLFALATVLLVRFKLSSSILVLVFGALGLALGALGATS